MVQQTLRERLSTSRRVRLHGRIGEALETLYGEQPEEHAAELAHHFSQAVSIMGPEKLVRYALMAGEKTLAGYAHEEAVGFFAQALDAKGLKNNGTAPATDEDTAALLYGLGRAQSASLDRQDLDVAFSNMRRAFEFYADTNDVDKAVNVIAHSIHALPGRHGGVDLVARDLQLVPSDSHDASRLWAKYVLLKGIEDGDYEGAVQAFKRSLEIAIRFEDVALEVRTLMQSAIVDVWHLRWQGAVAKGLRVVELATRTGDQMSELVARNWIGIVSLINGDADRARSHAPAVFSIAKRLGDSYRLASALWLNELVCNYEGDWQGAKEFSDQGLRLAPSDTRLISSRMVQEYQVGNIAGADEYMERLVESHRTMVPAPTYDQATVALLLPIVARITGELDRMHTATATPLVSQLARWGKALMAVQQGDAQSARELYVSLASGGGSYAFISADRVLGLLSHAMSEPGQAATHFEDALAFCRKAGYRPELAWTCFDYADSLLQSKSPGDSDKAASLLDEAFAISGDLGMRPLMDRVLALQERIEAAPVTVPAYPDGLTPREVEVLGLVAAGETDREIGEALVISVRTVTTHVGNILNKIGTANRTEATTYANRTGLG